ncbi:MAG: sugar phosphate nucleotidyltransferase [Spirochaetaceae bacterium]
MKPTLLVLAAGMGSRYGGLKQIDPIGPNGEIIIDYSIFDAVKAGFGKVVFVIRRDIEEMFKEHIGSRFEGIIPVEYAYQQLDDLPPGFKVPKGRTKPWGTGHAIFAAREVINEPFAVINADDFYGKSAYTQLAKKLSNSKDSDVADYSMVGFVLNNTLSENGFVSRGVCELGSKNILDTVVERTNIVKTESGAEATLENGDKLPLNGDEVVSMNFWGFTPSLFKFLESMFINFLDEKGTEQKSEFYIPSVVADLIAEGKAKAEVFTSADSWFGVTYPEDKDQVVKSVRELVENGTYPNKLF